MLLQKLFTKIPQVHTEKHKLKRMMLNDYEVL